MPSWLINVWMCGDVRDTTTLSAIIPRSAQLLAQLSILYPLSSYLGLCVCAIPAVPTHYKCMSYPPLSCYNLFLQFSFCSTYSLQLLHASSLTSSSPFPRLPEFSSYLYETENLTKNEFHVLRPSHLNVSRRETSFALCRQSRKCFVFFY